MTRSIGYSRPLGATPDHEAERRALLDAGAETVFVDRGQPTARDQPELSLCLATLKPGDTLIVTRAARLRPGLTGFVQTVAELTGRGVGFHPMAEAALASTASATDPRELLIALNALRGELVGIRTRAGMERAEAEGRRPGRPSVMSPERLAVARELRRQHRSIAHIANVIGVSPSAVQRALAPPRPS
ncbi:recombinase family protein [Microbacterium sp.]|uniref:recombinase family protein n=1 Tax=Microbacterium sp. TaxID=51671 RepID=UPI0035B26203